MRDLLNAAEMKAVDQRSIEEYGIPSLVLMERAALEVVKRARELLEPGLSGNEALEHGPGRERLLKERKRKTVWAVCGFGNNGADGAAAARMLTLQGFSSVILLPSLEGKRSRELEVQLSVAEKLGIPILTLGDPLPEACDLIIDAVFGIGLSRPVEGVYKELIGLMEEKRAAGAGPGGGGGYAVGHQLRHRGCHGLRRKGGCDCDLWHEEGGPGPVSGPGILRTAFCGGRGLRA